MVNGLLAKLRINKKNKPKDLFIKIDPISSLANEQFKNLVDRGIDLPVVLL